tara:strand:+ start:10633 stop:10794 length:162 start_codon:yes stop_codon:yes gene_type:complete
MKTSKSQEPIIRVGTELSCGTVVAILTDGVKVRTPEGVHTIPFSKAEELIYVD